ncbi:MAG: B12-binding domain-containing radical SAM protein [Planctomycetaceae bacterium]|nr:B12-binding domain-containing radical SAM protein [Planctomycetaceae bacterium]
MRILIVNPPHWAIGSRLAGEHLPPLGLLSVAGPLIDAGHHVQLLDADYSNMKIDQIVSKIILQHPDFLLLGHSGSTSAQPIINDITRSVREKNLEAKIIVGGVFPTFHWEEILCNNPQIDYIVCGEGEETCLKLITALENNQPPESVFGIAHRSNGNPVKTPSPPLIENLDRFRIAWELMDGYHYTYWGKRKAAVVQFSRGCPYPCVYCGQSLFWKKWRHRNPQLFANELEMLHKKYGVEVFNFADENMSSQPDVWKEFLEALIAKNLNLILVGSIRTDNIVRDADILHLYKKAGFERFLLGIENYDESVIKKINKAGTISKDKEAICLLRKHGILSMATYVIGFGDERIGDFYRSLKQLLIYDPDQIQLLFVTPHRWTPFFDEIKHKEVILTDQRQWDYKHQVLVNKHLPAWLIFLCSKFIEVTMQARPKALYRLLCHKDAKLRQAMRWYTQIGRRVWFWEWYQFWFVTKLTKKKITLEEFWKNSETKKEQ